MTNIPKPELERGNFICYADEPDTIVDNAGGGGGDDVVVIEGVATDASIEMQASYDDLYEHFSNGKICFLHIADDQYSTYGMLHISNIAHAAKYKAGVVWTISGGTPTVADFEADSATDNFVFTMGG